MLNFCYYSKTLKKKFDLSYSNPDKYILISADKPEYSKHSGLNKFKISTYQPIVTVTDILFSMISFLTDSQKGYLTRDKYKKNFGNTDYFERFKFYVDILNNLKIETQKESLDLFEDILNTLSSKHN